MITTLDFLQRVEIDRATLEVWIEEEWIAPERSGGAFVFSEADLARARLIRDLIDDMGVNAAGVGVALNLLDQVHGLRSVLAQVLTAARAQGPEPR